MKYCLQVIKDSWPWMILAFSLAIVGDVAKSQTAEATYCQERGSSLVTAKETVISGEQMVFGDWIVPHDTITVRFNDEPVLIWNQDSIEEERHGALGDWIATALRLQRESGIAPFAGQDESEQVWLVSQYRDYQGNWACFAHPLD